MPREPNDTHSEGTNFLESVIPPPDSISSESTVLIDPVAATEVERVPTQVASLLNIEDEVE